MRVKAILKILPLLLLVFVASCASEEDDDAPHSLGREFFLTDGSQFHGTSSLNCGSCHGGTIANCTKCHFGPAGTREPAGVSWTHGLASHNTAELEAVGDVCVRCHSITNYYTGFPTLTTCQGCH